MVIDRLFMLACVIRYSLVPVSPADAAALPASPLAGEYPAIARSGTAAWLAAPDRFVDRQSGTLSATFPDCPALAGPFLLFRLKRLGFSGARVKVTPRGLEVCARR